MKAAVASGSSEGRESIVGKKVASEGSWNVKPASDESTVDFVPCSGRLR
jgi:hypothetical protein